MDAVPAPVDKSDGRAARTPSRRRAKFLLGTLIGLSIPLVSAELYLRSQPPPYIRTYLGEDCPLDGPFVADDALPYRFRSVEALLDTTGASRQELLGLLATRGAGGGPAADGTGDRRRPWVILGNSFAGYAPDTFTWRIRTAFPEQPMFNLAAVGHGWYWHLAQLKTLLESGCRPSRCIITVVPVDLLDVGQHSIESHHVTRRGALTFRPRLPVEPFGTPVARTRLGLAAWVRTGRQYSQPGFDKDSLYKTDGAFPATFEADVAHLVQEVARLSGRCDMQVTFVLIPAHRQVVRGGGFPTQDLIVACAEAMGLGCVDPRETFLNAPDRRALYVPDHHLSAEGNRLVADALREQLIRTNR